MALVCGVLLWGWPQVMSASDYSTLAAVREQEAGLLQERETELLVKYQAGAPSGEEGVCRLQGMVTAQIAKRVPVAPGLEVLRLYPGIDPGPVMVALRQAGSVQYVEPNRRQKLTVMPDDPFFARQWGLTTVGFPQAWERLATARKTVIVAVIDSGIAATHEDLQDRIAPGGYNFVLDNADPLDINGHGTAVAGIVAAATSNGKGIAGVAGVFPVKILPVKVAYYDGTVFSSDTVRGINFAVQANVDVINLSLGGREFSQAENEAVQNALRQGIVVVAAAGNEGAGVYDYPAAYPGVVAVGSVGLGGGISVFSNFNDAVDVSAPGEEIYTCDHTGGYRYMTGTSFAAPVVAGLAGLLKAGFPWLTGGQIAGLVCETATDWGIPGKDIFFGWGVVDADRALAAAAATFREWAPPPPVTVTKEWTVRFNRPLAPGSLSAGITVWDDQDCRVPVTLKLAGDGWEVVVGPPVGGYLAGRNYQLDLGKALRTQTGQPLAYPVKMPFVTLP
ncbi:MAG: S8 family serine peptidase [Heliobacteriaceae bacterium]|nr:S8 family serine peptidase [Heliobacteriaceae bacterium]